MKRLENKNIKIVVDATKNLEIQLNENVIQIQCFYKKMISDENIFLKI